MRCEVWRQSEELGRAAPRRRHVRRIIKEHGVTGWADFLKAKSDIEAQDKLEASQVSEDEKAMNDATWWCFAAGALIAFLIING